MDKGVVSIIGNVSNDCLSVSERKAMKKTLQDEIEKAIESGRDYFISGMNLGFETWGADDVLRFKKGHPQARLECFLPYEEVATHWKEYQRDRFFRILEHCDKETLLQYEYTYGCLKTCYRHMIHRSSLLIVGWDKNIFSDCGYAVRYARERGTKIIEIDCR